MSELSWVQVIPYTDTAHSSAALSCHDPCRIQRHCQNERFILGFCAWRILLHSVLLWARHVDLERGPNERAELCARPHLPR